MFQHIPFRTIPWFAALLLACLPTAKADDKKNQTRLRFICASSLAEDQKVVLASRDAEGKWQELGNAELRASLITDWFPANSGELHLALREEGGLKSICSFTYPAGARHALVALIADAEENVYEAHAVDPEKTGFVEGSILILNCSPHAGLVSLGTGEERVEAGQRLVAKPTMADNGTYRMMVSYVDADGKTVSCHDRYVSSTPNSRSMLFLLPDKTLGLRVLDLPMFGALD